MNRPFGLLLFVVVCLVLVPLRAPAPLFYVPGEGWYYEMYGQNARWQRPRAKEQLDVAEQAFAKEDFNTALHAAHRILRVWPLSDYAPDAEYLIGRCLETTGKDEAAFKAYQNIIEKYPRSSRYDEVLWRQYEIANRFLGGQWFWLWVASLIPRWIKRRKCSTKSSTTVLTATSPRTRNCASAPRAKNRKIIPMR